MGFAKCYRALLDRLGLRQALLRLHCTYEEKLLLGLVEGSYFASEGWLRSQREGRCVDAEGRPIPWLPYPLVSFLSDRLRPDWQVLEYGCGASTLYFAAHSAAVVSIEHDEGWFAKMRAELPGNAEILFLPLTAGTDYERAAERWPGRFHLVLIDGRRRVACLDACLHALHPTGVLIVDNSERQEYAEMHRTLAAQGFRRLDFWGIAALALEKQCSTLFYRDGNCLGL